MTAPNSLYQEGYSMTDNTDRLASVSSASAEPRKDTIAFVQDWLMNADYDPTQFDKDFAAAIDARHGFNDAALTAIAERFCAASLPDTVCADLVAIKPMAGRSGTNLMTVAEAKAVLRSIFPEPVPATNQAGEVLTDWERALIAHALPVLQRFCPEALATQPATSQEGEAVEALAQFLHDEGGFGDAMTDRTWPDHADDTGQREGGWVKIVPADVQAHFRDVARRWLGSRLATQPATLQEGANWRVVLNTARQTVKTRDDMQTALNIIESVATKALAATSTPPTLSEDLREALDWALAHIECRTQYDRQGQFQAALARSKAALNAALAQVKAS